MAPSLSRMASFLVPNPHEPPTTTSRRESIRTDRRPRPRASLHARLRCARAACARAPRPPALTARCPAPFEPHACDLRPRACTPRARDLAATLPARARLVLRAAAELLRLRSVLTRATP